MKFVEVVWIDACMSSGWEGLEELVAPRLAKTRGWLVGEEKDHIVIAHTVGVEDEDKDVGGTIAILRANIKKMRKVKV